MLELHFPRDHTYAVFTPNTHRECDPTIHSWVVETYARMRLSETLARERGNHCLPLPGGDWFVDPTGRYWLGDDAGFDSLAEALTWLYRESA